MEEERTENTSERMEKFRRRRIGNTDAQAREIQTTVRVDSQNMRQAEQQVRLDDELAAGTFATNDSIPEVPSRKSKRDLIRHPWASFRDLVDSIKSRGRKWQQSCRIRKAPKVKQTLTFPNEGTQVSRPLLVAAANSATPQTHKLKNTPVILQIKEGGMATLEGTDIAFVTAERINEDGEPHKSGLSRAEGVPSLERLSIGHQPTLEADSDPVEIQDSVPLQQPTGQAERRYTLAPCIDEAANFLGTVILRTSSGIDSEHLLHDTGSSDNIISQELVDKHGLVRRHIHPDDLKVFDTASGTKFAPIYYVEAEIQDKALGIADFTKVSFYVAESLGRRVKMLVGSKFLASLDVRLVVVTKENGGVFICRGRPASQEAKKDQQLLIEKQARDRELAQQYAASSTGSTVANTKTTEARQPASSRTSTPSVTEANNTIKD